MGAAFALESILNQQNESCYGCSLELIRDEQKFRQFSKIALSAVSFGGISRGRRSFLNVLKSGFSLTQFTCKDECWIPLIENLPHGMDAETAILYQDRRLAKEPEVSNNI